MRDSRTDERGESTTKTGLAVLLTGLMVFSVLVVPGVAGTVAASGASEPTATGATQASAAADGATADAAAIDAATAGATATDAATVDAAAIDAATAGAADTTATSDVSLQVSIGKGGFGSQQSYQSDATVNIAVSAVDTSGTLPEPVSGVDMTINVTDPNGETTSFTRTSTDGAVSVQYSLEGRPDGSYDVRATSDNASVTSGRTSFNAGPIINFYPDFIDAKIEVGRQTQITMSANAGGVPQSGVTRTVTISEGFSSFDPDFSKTVTTGSNGFATVNFTANSTGDYRVSLESSSGGTSLTAVEAFADVDTNGPAFGQVDGGETVYFTGRLVDDAAPLSNEAITVRIVNESATPTQQMTNISTTTDEYGQFVVSWQTPDNEGKSYKAQIYDSNGNRIKYDGGSVFTRFEDERFSGGGGGDGTSGTTTSIDTSLDVPSQFRGRLSSPSKVVAPGQTVSATVIPRVNGTAQANKQVSYALTYGFGGAVLESGTVTTNGSGIATLQFTVPESAPDGADLSLDTAATLNGNTTKGFGGAAIQDYRVTVTEQNPLTFSGSGFFGATSTFSGQSTGYVFNFTDVPTGNPVEGARAMVVAGASDRFHATSFGAQAATSNASGIATTSIDIPETVAGTVRRNPHYPYWTGVSTGEKVDGYNVTIDGPSGTLDPGGTATFSYTTDSDTAASGILVVATFNESVDEPVVAARRLDPGQSTQVSFPNLAYNVSYTAQITSINDRALTASSTTNVKVLGNGSDIDTNSPPEAVAAADPLTANVSESVEFRALDSTDSDGQITSYQWDFGDGSTGSGESTTHSFSSSGTYTATLTVTDDQGATDTDTVTVTVESGTESGADRIVSRFESGTEGWTVVGDAEGSSNVPNWAATDGNPGGHLYATDNVVGGVWDWNASEKFLGDKSRFLGGSLSYDLNQSRTDDQFDAPDVRLVGEQMTLEYKLGDASTHPDTNWTSYQIPIRSTSKWRVASTKGNTTRSDFEAVLSSLQALQIRGEYRTGSDTGRLDNVVLSQKGTGAVGRVGFDYVNQGGSVNLEVNGDREYNFSSVANLDGSTVGGVSVNVTTTAPNAGHVELTGPIDTFAVGGQETEVDNIEFGPQSNVTFNTVSPSKSNYVVGDSITADGVPAQIIDFTFTDGRVYQQGSASVDSATPQPPGGSAPSFATTNVNLWFNVTDVVERAGDDSGTGDANFTASRSAPDTIAPNGSETVTVETTVSNSSASFQEVFSPAFDSVSIKSVTVNGQQVTPFLAVANSSGIVVSLQGLTAGDRVAVTYEVSVGPNVQTGTNYTIDGNVTSGTTTQLPSNPIAVQKTGCLSLPDVARQYDSGGDCNIDITELGQAAAAYAKGDLDIVKLGTVASAYAQS